MNPREIEARALGPLETFRDKAIADGFTALERRKVEGSVSKLLRITSDDQFVETAKRMVGECQEFWENGDPAVLANGQKNPFRSLAMARMRTSLRRTAEIDFDSASTEDQTEAIKSIREGLQRILVEAQTAEVLDIHREDLTGSDPLNPASKPERAKTPKKAVEKERRKKDTYVSSSGTSGRHNSRRTSGRFSH